MIELLEWLYQHQGFSGALGFVICFCVFYFDIKIRIGFGKPGKPFHQHEHIYNYKSPHDEASNEAAAEQRVVLDLKTM